jgi:hypothetical protein
MKQKWKDYFTDECDTCGGDLAKDGLVYVIRGRQGICAECYDSVSVFLIDMTVEEIEIEDGNACPCCSKQLTEGSCTSCGETYE